MTTSDNTSPQQNIEPFITDGLSAARRDSDVGRLNSKPGNRSISAQMAMM